MFIITQIFNIMYIHLITTQSVFSDEPSTLATSTTDPVASKKRNYAITS